ncbi:MAG: DUF885 domain-containing protein [Thermoplasmata archaeon]|nr:DUF885 domain-containing protein [Thermoplasmata archaeon]
MVQVSALKPAADPLGSVEVGILEHVFSLSPSYGVFLGLHEYDGRLPDLSGSFTDRWCEGADRWLATLGAIPEHDLAADRRLDRQLLGLLLHGPLFDIRDSHDLERNPMSYVGSISLTSYMVREYAPLPERVEAMARTLEAVPALLDTATQRLDRILPEPFLRLSLAIGGGLPVHFAEAEALARSGSAALAGRIAAARAPAETAVQQFLHLLQHEYVPRQTPDFALGPARYQRLLWVREGVKTPFSEIESAGWADLRRNQARLHELAATRDPPQTIPQLLEGVFRDHPTAAALVPTAQEMVAEAKEFVRAKDLVTIPEPAICRVEETPTYGRALSTASMNPPGPYDVTGDEGIYFVTPVDATWTPERQEEWLRSLNRSMLRNITMHEVYPGHYLQFLHVRRRRSASHAQKVFFSASFVEGWAHYCEQLSIEAGLSDRSVEAEVAQLHDALLRDCRLLASIGLHTAGQTLEQATQLFQKEGHLERLPAEREAIRGTFNPEYYCYTLGKLAILDLRAKMLQKGYGGSLRRFHDRLLEFGSPPVGALSELMAPT